MGKRTDPTEASSFCEGALLAEELESPRLPRRPEARPRASRAEQEFVARRLASLQALLRGRG